MCIIHIFARTDCTAPPATSKRSATHYGDAGYCGTNRPARNRLARVAATSINIIIYCIQDGVADRATASATKQCIYISGHHEDGTDQGPIDDATDATHGRCRGVVHHFVFFLFTCMFYSLYLLLLSIFTHVLIIRI
jgi:hypothetical protein